MPELYAFVACDKVIIDDMGTASLISLFGNIIVTLPQNAEVPSNALVPKEWALFASWDCGPDDDGKEFSQVVQVLHPDGRFFIERMEAKFVMQRDKKSQIKMPFVGFPVGQQGKVMIRMWLEQAGQEIFAARPIHLEVSLAAPAAAQN